MSAPRMVGVRWRGRVYMVPKDMEAYKANALLATGEAQRVYADASKKEDRR